MKTKSKPRLSVEDRERQDRKENVILISIVLCTLVGMCALTLILMLTTDYSTSNPITSTTSNGHYHADGTFHFS